MYYVIAGLAMLASWWVSNQLQRKFAEYSRVPLGLTGKEIAERMLRENNIFDVKVTHVPGALTDHYNPMNKTVNLSEPVYMERSVAAAAVAAHECGHAVQHAKAYPALQMRSALVPAVKISTNLANIVIMIGIVLAMAAGYPWVLLLGIVLFGITTLFSLITLPVEFDASNRALAWLRTSGIVRTDEQGMAADALKWAAMTYVVAALASLAQLFYFIMLFLRARR